MKQPENLKTDRQHVSDYANERHSPGGALSHIDRIELLREGRRLERLQTSNDRDRSASDGKSLTLTDPYKQDEFSKGVVRRDDLFDPKNATPRPFNQTEPPSAHFSKQATEFDSQPVHPVQVKPTR